MFKPRRRLRARAVDEKRLEEQVKIPALCRKEWRPSSCFEITGKENGTDLIDPCRCHGSRTLLSSALPEQPGVRSVSKADHACYIDQRRAFERALREDAAALLPGR
jgi:hypothetical protein